MEAVSKIMSCHILDCSYNTNKRCQALAITVGHPTASYDTAHPTCHTFTPLANKEDASSSVADVGECKEYCCEFNQTLVWIT